MADHIVWQYCQDVWQIRVVNRRRHSKLGGLESYYYEFGYFRNRNFFSIIFHDALYVRTDNPKPRPAIFEEKAAKHKRKLRRFPTQKTLSDEILKYLRNPHRAFGNFNFRYHCTELLYRGIPVPIFRDDFPNRTAIIMAIETKLVHLKKHNPEFPRKSAMDYFLKYLKERISR